MKIVIHVAIAGNGVIGRENGLPWRLSSDMKRFKATTMGKPIIMGRKTWESFPRRPLPGRLNIVLTREAGFQADGAEIVGSLDAALELASERSRNVPGANEICILGGGEVYRQALPLADRLYVTHVLADVDGDTTFPPIDPAIWTKVHSEDHPTGEKDSHATRYAVYDRRESVH